MYYINTLTQYTMPYNGRRRRQPRKRYSPPSRWQIYGSAAKQLASDAMAGVKQIKQLVNTEFDFLDNNSNPTASAAGTLTLLNGMTQGDTASSREGNSIRMKSYNLRYVINNNSTAVNTFTRIILFVDKQANGAAPATLDLLATNSVTSPRDLDNRKRFKILYDKTIALGTAGPANYYGEFFKKDVQTHVAYYNGSNAGTVADIATNSLYMLVMSDQAVNYPSVNAYFRLRFIDN